MATQVVALVADSDKDINSVKTKEQVQTHRWILLVYFGFMLLYSLINLHACNVLNEARKGVNIEKEEFKRH